MQSGREQLSAWIDRRFLNVRGKQSEAALFLGIDQSYLSQILAGLRRPGLETAFRIEHLTGISAKAWLPQPSAEPATADSSSGHNRLHHKEQ